MDSLSSKDSMQVVQQQLSILSSFASNTHKCFMKCVPKPGRTLTRTEESCVVDCVDRYRDAQVFLMTRIQEQSELEKNKSGMVS
jgi:Tim10/DDP family zinc finger